MKDLLLVLQSNDNGWWVKPKVTLTAGLEVSQEALGTQEGAPHAGVCTEGREAQDGHAQGQSTTFSEAPLSSQ